MREEHVLGFEVAVHHRFGVEVLKDQHYLRTVESYQRHLESAQPLDQSEKLAAFYKVHEEVERLAVLCDPFEADYKRMFDLLL